MYRKSINHVLEKLTAHEDEIMKVLLRIESRYTAEDEFACALKCMNGAMKESAYWGENGINTFASFMAVNLPLFGLTLGLLSSLAAKETFIRPASDTQEIVCAISDILRIHDDFPNFHIVEDVSRQEFLDKYVATADAVYFVGAYNNAKKVQAITKPNALFMFSGTGMNPMIVTENADVSLAVEKAVAAGIYNSGQDCGRPKVHLVHRDVADAFLAELKSHLDEVVCDDFGNPDAQVVPLLRDSVFQDAVSTIFQNRGSIYRDSSGHPSGGCADLTRKIISPTILNVSLDDKVIFKEFFAPVFTVAVYDSVDDLKNYFKADRYYLNAMYAFVFGTLPDELDLSGHTIVMHNQSLLDDEDGNKPFGGYGKRANYIYNGSHPEARPFLISEELYKFGNRRKRKNRNVA